MFRSRITIFPLTFRSLIKLKDYIHGARQAFKFYFSAFIEKAIPTPSIKQSVLPPVSCIIFLYIHGILMYMNL